MESDDWGQEEEGAVQVWGDPDVGRHTERNRRKRKARAVRKIEAATAAAAAEGQKAGSEVTSGAAPGTLGTQMTPSASPVSDDRVELGGAPLEPTRDGSPEDATPPAVPVADKEGIEEGWDEEPPPKRQLRPRNAAGAVVTPPKPKPERVFRKGGGRN